MDRRITNGIAVLISTVWAASFIADIFVALYDPSPFIHMMMMGVAGAIFGQGFLKGVSVGTAKEAAAEVDAAEDARAQGIAQMREAERLQREWEERNRGSS